MQNKKPIIMLHGQTSPATFTKTTDAGNLSWWHTVILNNAFSMSQRLQALSNVNKTMGIADKVNEQSLQDYVTESNLEIVN